MIVPTLRVGTPLVTLCVTVKKRTRSVLSCAPTQSVGAIVLSFGDWHTSDTPPITPAGSDRAPWLSKTPHRSAAATDTWVAAVSASRGSHTPLQFAPAAVHNPPPS